MAKIKVPKIDWESEMIVKSSNNNTSHCADIVVINQSWDGILPALVANTDDVIVNGILLHYGQSFTFSAFGNEMQTKQVSVTFLSTVAPKLFIARKYYRGLIEIEI